MKFQKLSVMFLLGSLIVGNAPAIAMDADAQTEWAHVRARARDEVKKISVGLAKMIQTPGWSILKTTKKI